MQAQPKNKTHHCCICMYRGVLQVTSLLELPTANAHAGRSKDHETIFMMCFMGATTDNEIFFHH